MYLAALDRFAEDMLNTVAAAEERPTAPDETLTAFFDTAIAFYCSGTAPGCLVLCTATADAPIADPDALTVLMSGVLLGIAIQARAGVAETRLREVARASVSAALGGTQGGVQGG